MEQVNGTLEDLVNGPVSSDDFDTLILVVNSKNYDGKPGMKPKTKPLFEWKLESIVDVVVAMTKPQCDELLTQNTTPTGNNRMRRALAYDITGQIPFVASLKQDSNPPKTVIPNKTFYLHTILEWIDDEAVYPVKNWIAQQAPAMEAYVPFDQPDRIEEHQQRITQLEAEVAELKTKLALLLV